ncbi:DUF6087 family protein [Streptomyces sp. DSM 116496]|uniref:DUF6087 family protein n=1 Tax=Streptomyces stoeckheimensis TaxID=3344656 RepID=UPI0038B28C74
MGEREEPLEQWADLRDQRRASDRQITGRRRAEPLDPAARGRAAHLAPDAPPASFWSSTSSRGNGCPSESPTTPPRLRSSSPADAAVALDDTRPQRSWPQDGV